MKKLFSYLLLTLFLFSSQIGAQQDDSSEGTDTRGLSTSRNSESFDDYVQQIKDDFLVSSDDLESALRSENLALVARYESNTEFYDDDAFDLALEGAEKLNGFIDKHIRGKNKERLLLVAYVIYKQVAWIARKRWAESNTSEPKVFSVSNILIKGGYSSLYFWLGVSQQVMAIKDLFSDPQRLQARIEQDPRFIETEMERFYSLCQRAYYCFSHTHYYGDNISFVQQIGVALILPFIYASFLSNRSNGNALNHEVFQDALNNCLAITNQAVSGAVALSIYRNEKLKNALYDKSLGVVTPEFVQGLFSQSFQHFAQRNYSSISYKDRMTTFVGSKVIYSFVTEAILSSLALAVRSGSWESVWNVCSGFMSQCNRLGITKRNPFNSLSHKIEEVLRSLGVLLPGKNRVTDNIFFTSFFPDAYLRAYKKVASKVSLQRSLLPRVGQELGHIDGMTTGQMFALMSAGVANPLQMKNINSIVSSIESTYAILSEVQKDALNKIFIREAIVGLFLDRKSVLCTYLTENIVYSFSAPLLRSIEEYFLPLRVA